MKYVFGPVPSRRLGRSLGIDPLPLKTCNWNCVYCQLGRTKPLTNERREYFPRQEILDEVKASISAHKPDEIDWVTFIGSGEPTLHSGLGWLIRQVKAFTELPVAVITNGALFYQPEVRQEVAAADAVLPTLDACTPGRYIQINRPHPDITFDRMLNGLISFRQGYRGKLWVEVMLVRGLNDSEQGLHDLAACLCSIQPDEIHINLPTRPPAETWVLPPDEDSLLRARRILGNIARVVQPASGTFDLSGFDNLADAVISIITRHPMREDELIQALEHWSPGEIDSVLQELKSSRRAQVVNRLGVRFWSAASSHYPDPAQSQHTAPHHQKHRNKDSE